MPVQNLDTSNFKATLESATRPVIVDFYADWCAPCKMIEPVMADIANTNDTVDVYRVNVDENPGLAEAFAVMSIPTIISFKNAQIYKKAVGAQGKAGILSLVD